MEWFKIIVIIINKFNIDGNNKNVLFKRNKFRIFIEFCLDGIRKFFIGDRRDFWFWCVRILVL